MRVKKTDFNSFRCWLSINDTRQFFNNWPCSTLKGRGVYFEIFKGDLVDLEINGKSPSINYNGYELQVLVKNKEREIMGDGKT